MSNEMERFLLSVLALTVSWLTARGGTFPTATTFPYIEIWLVLQKCVRLRSYCFASLSRS